MSRDDACLYTRGARALATREDAARDAALRADVLPRDALLGGGKEWEAAAAAAAARFDAEAAARARAAAPAAGARARAGAGAGAAPPRYGESGAVAPDVPVVPLAPPADARAARPGAAEDVLDAVAAGSARRSGVKR